MIIFGILGFIANSLLIWLIYRKKSQRTVFDVTLWSLGLADFLTSAMIFSFGVTGTMGLSKEKPIMIFLWSGGLSTQLISFLHMLFIAIQRLGAIIYPLTFRMHFTIWRSYVTLFVLWALTAVFSTLLAVVISPNVLFMTICIFASGGILIVLYSAICCKIRRNKRLAQVAPKVNRNASYRVRVHSFVVMLVFIICTFPYAFTVIYPLGWAGSLVTDILFALNAFVDPLVYFLVSYCRHNQVTNSGGTNPRRAAPGLQNVQI